MTDSSQNDLSVMQQCCFQICRRRSRNWSIMTTEANSTFTYRSLQSFGMRYCTKAHKREPSKKDSITMELHTAFCFMIPCSITANRQIFPGSCDGKANNYGAVFTAAIYQRIRTARIRATLISTLKPSIFTMINLYNTKSTTASFTRLETTAGTRRFSCLRILTRSAMRSGLFLKEFFFKPFREKEEQYFRFSEDSELG